MLYMGYMVYELNTLYIIEVYLRGKKEPERRKVARIIDVIHEKGLELPTIEQAQIVINENGKR